VSTTGHGESFMRTCLAKHIAILMEQGNAVFIDCVTASTGDQRVLGVMWISPKKFIYACDVSELALRFLRLIVSYYLRS
jgi:isoaspartyl peptidase/L-asparaginase-like protein (Ntn-hydrolase superfamily)